MARVTALATKRDREQGPVQATVPAIDANRRLFKGLREVASMLGALEFSLMRVLSTDKSLRLAPMIDSDTPGPSALTRSCSGRHADAFAKAVLASTLPARWLGASTPEQPCPSGRWTRRVAPPAPGWNGIAFPVPAERGNGAMALFTEPCHLDDEAICRAHLACFELYQAEIRSAPESAAGLPVLSKRELECLKLTADGLTSEEIAGRLGLSVHTANQYLANTTQKLNAVNRMHAVAKALRSGLFE
jgi:DNA-binding CsgD family transcriptional regulator